MRGRWLGALIAAGSLVVACANGVVDDGPGATGDGGQSASDSGSSSGGSGSGSGAGRDASSSGGNDSGSSSGSSSGSGSGSGSGSSSGSSGGDASTGNDANTVQDTGTAQDSGGGQDSSTGNGVCPSDFLHGAEAATAIASGKFTICFGGGCAAGQCCYVQLSPGDICVAQ